MVEEKQQEAPGAVSFTKMRDISSPAENDILCGRSKETHHHPGNLSYRGLVNLNKVGGFVLRVLFVNELGYFL